MDTFALYCDESGNSGPNYIDKDQPFYVLAGWFIPESSLVSVSVELEKIRAEYVPDNHVGKTPLDAGEAKSTTLLRTNRGLRRLTSLFEFMGRSGCLPIFLVAEKRYCVAAKMVETFLDPDTNEKFAMRFTGDTVTKNEIANTLYDQLSQGILDDFANVYRNPSTDSLREILDRICDSVRSGINSELADALAGALPRIDEIARPEIESAKLWNGAAGTLNLPCLVSFLMLVEHNAQNCSVNISKLVHDEQAHYQAGYEAVFDMFLTAKDSAISLPHTDVSIAKIKNIPMFEIATRVNPIMQSADFLAGTVNYLFKKITNGTDLTDVERNLAEFVLPALVLPDNPKLTWPILSQRTMTKSFAAIRGLLGDESVSDTQSSARRPIVPEMPVFPVVDGDTKPHNGQRVKIDLPLFVPIGDKTDSPLFIRSFEDNAEHGCFVTLFTREQTAEEFLSACRDESWTESFHVERFDVPQLTQILELLDFYAKHTDLVYVFDSPLLEPKPTSVKHLREGLSQVMSRIERAFLSGAGDLIFQRHQHGDVEFASLLASSGQYVARVLPDGNLYTGESREEVVQNLLDGEELSK
ncbi:DUF3800 domain-containing protein [Stieleria sp. TO1_6]|uniref:DUF3800 domain-containing protein n=1 Tax=Stieleria tagensis TaxID=2956795 RepID=UPI00209B7427|nr:DUF3800 domain-containing protein [Stieleria tagensis]MCO8121333.1 DUF3800 domain-containing protein [Stieleria tagensis]